MTSLGVWTISNPFPPGFKIPGLENRSFLEVASASKDGFVPSKNGQSVKVQTEGPHLVSLGGGRLNAAITIHPVPEGRVYVGNAEAQPPKDVVIYGLSIERDHCFIDNNNGLVTIYPQSGDVSIDGVYVTEPTCLSQGSILCLGRSNYFRFNNPKEAHLMKQASPTPRQLPYSAGFIPVESLSQQQPQHNPNQPITNPYMDGLDLVEKVSKYEYMSHSQLPTVTSQDTPKYLVKEGIRILHSAPPLMRVHKGYSSETSIKNPSPVSRLYSPLIAKPGFSTPPPYLHRAAPKLAMSPKTTRMFSKTPDPVIMSRKSPATAWSGRCTPTSPMMPGGRSHHVSAENLKACEIELHEQHRKAVQERLRDQEQEKQERQRLEEILHLCAEYEENAQKVRANKSRLDSSKPHPTSNSSSGDFSSVSTDSSAPASTNSSNHVSSKSGSNIEGCSSKDFKCNGIPKYPTLPTAQIPQSQLTAVNVKPNSSNYAVISGYHTVPNRIKTNGSLPRDRGNNQLSPTSDCPFSQVEGVISNNNGATLYVNHKALNSASSEDELCAILGNSSVTKQQSPTTDCAPASPCMGTAFLTYPHSPRTRIKTVAGHRERGPEVYENKMAVSEVTPKKNMTLPIPSRDVLTCGPPEKTDYFDGAKYMNDNYHQSSNHFGFELVEEINKLQKEKQEILQAITNIKHKVSELDCQKNEVLNELQLELALISGELKDKEQLQMFEGNKLSELQKQKISIDQKYEHTQQELESAKAKIHEQENLVQSIQTLIHTMKVNSVKELEIQDKMEELKAQSDLLDIERKAFEDLEFHQLESQAHEEEEKEELGQEIECFKETIAQRQIQLSELTKQKQSLTTQMDSEKARCDSQLRLFTEQLRQEVSNLDMINSKLKALTSVKPGATPCSSPESSPRTSDSDIEVKRNGVWNVQSHLISDDNISSRRQSGERSENCNSFHSFESESSSLTSSDTNGENGRRSEDKTKPVDSRVHEANKVLQKEHALQSAFQDQTPLVNHHHENGNFEVKRRDKPRAQRPLTRYLPVRNAEFDLRQHIESAGHQIELCTHIHLTASSCHGHLHKLGSTWKTWKKRWFVFDRLQRALLYYSDRGETKLKGGVNFKEIEEVYVDHLHSVKSPNPQSTFCVKTYDRVYYLMAPTPEAMRIWVDVIFTGAEGYLDFLGEAE